MPARKVATQHRKGSAGQGGTPFQRLQAIANSLRKRPLVRSCYWKLEVAVTARFADGRDGHVGWFTFGATKRSVIDLVDQLSWERRLDGAEGLDFYLWLTRQGMPVTDDFPSIDITPEVYAICHEAGLAKRWWQHTISPSIGVANDR